MLCDNTIWLERPELKTKKVFNWQISEKKKVLIEIIYKLSKKGSYEINKLRDEKKMLLIKRFSESEHRYWLVVRLKAIEYKEDFIYYLSSIASS